MKGWRRRYRVENLAEDEKEGGVELTTRNYSEWNGHSAF
jgi:hypothetical protein